MQRVNIIVHGFVQGVLFRYNTKKEALSLGLKGYVRNMEDSNVEIVAEGTEDKLNELIEFCKKHKKIGWIAQLDGKWDFATVVWAKDAVEFEKVIDELLNKFGAYFDNKSISVATKIYHFKHKFLLKKHESNELVLGGKVEESELDEVDYNILGILTKNARIPLLRIGEELKISPKVARYRIKNLLISNFYTPSQVKYLCISFHIHY